MHKNNNHLIHSEKLVLSRKTFFFDLKENSRGKFVKITEDVNGNRDTIMLPSEGISEFIAALQNIEQAAQD